MRPSSLFTRKQSQPLPDLDVVTHDAADAPLRLSAKLRTEMGVGVFADRINILAIGSDRTTGDCLGPLVGDFLSGVGPFVVYGTLGDPLHAANMADVVRSVEGYTIAIDAALGNPVGGISVRRGSLAPGAAFGRELPHVGDVSVSALVCEAGPLGFERLRSVRLGFVRDVAHCIAVALAGAVGVALTSGPGVTEPSHIRA